MMRNILCTVVIVVICDTGFSQSQKRIDSLKYKLSYTRQDIHRIRLLDSLYHAYQGFQKDSCLFYGYKGLETARTINDTENEAHALINISVASRIYGDGPQSLLTAFKGLEIAEAHNYTLEQARALYSIGTMYGNILDDYSKAISYFQLAKEKSVPKSENVFPGVLLDDILDLNFGTNYLRANRLDSSLYYLGRLRKKMARSDEIYPVVEMSWADLQSLLGNFAAALEASDNALQIVVSSEIKSRITAEVYYFRAKLFDKLNKMDSSIYYAQQAIATAEKIGFARFVLLAGTFLAEQFESKDLQQSFYYHKKAGLASDMLYGKKKLQEIQKILAEDQERKKIIAAERVASANRVKQYLFVAGLAAMLFIAFILYRNNQKEKKAKNLLQEKNDKIERTLRELKATQAQLIQSEKMASLGELTAGIAHEIQNPLNFVNNFSEVNDELIEEMKQEYVTGNMQQANKIADDIKQNLEKISHHGRRADAIVKGMLQHSRTSTGVKELTDINALCDEYLRLAFHGLRAKDKSFNAKIETDFDNGVGKINIIPQEIGRVALNLINNAFYACTELSRSTASLPSKGGFSDPKSNETPTVWLSTKKDGHKILISVKDNGPGIPGNILDKIFQPFFTTKPTGQGTGLGLSLSYDIVKAHGGELKVETKEGEGAEFIISLPVN